MAKRRRWGLPTAVAATLLIGVAGGALLGRWLREPTPASVAVALAPALAPAPPEPVPEAVAPIRPAPVTRLSALLQTTPALLLAHVWAWSGAADPSPNQASGFAALQFCPSLRRAGPNELEPLLAQARDDMTTMAGGLRARVAVSLPVAADGRLALPSLEEPLRLRVAATPDPSCAAAYAASGQPRFFDLRVVGPPPWGPPPWGPPPWGPAPWGPAPWGPAPWGPAHQIQPGRSGALFGDLVIDLGESSPLEGGGVAVTAQAIALYLWSDATRTSPLGALGLAASDSQDVPASANPAVVEASDQAAATLAGKPVSAELARRASQTSGVQLPPISTAPRQSVETQPLPPPLTR